MDWGVVADANEEDWLGDMLGVARGGLPADLCGVFLFVLVGSNVSIPFMLSVQVRACLCKISISENGMIFIF